MRPAKKHRITAAFFDIFIIGSWCEAVEALLIAFTSPSVVEQFDLFSTAAFIIGIIV